MRLVPTLLCLGLALALTACNRDAGETTEPVSPTPTAANDDAAGTVPDAAPADAAGGTMLAASAIATLQPAVGGTAGGTLNFAIDNGGVRMSGGLTGLTPGMTHAMHIHAVGNCSAPDFSSAGDHFNPESLPHGDRAGTGTHHAGDMPNQVADADGNAAVDQLLDGLNIDSGDPMDIVGKAVVLHERADDYLTQPSGNAGARIACGVIELENPAPAYNGPADGGPVDPAPAAAPDADAAGPDADTDA